MHVDLRLVPPKRSATDRLRENHNTGGETSPSLRKHQTQDIKGLPWDTLTVEAGSNQTAESSKIDLVETAEETPPKSIF